MQAAGRGDQFRGQMRAEIAQRVAQLKRLDALITDRDRDLLRDSDGGGDGASDARGRGRGASVPAGVGGMMQKARVRMGAAKIGS